MVKHDAVRVNNTAHEHTVAAISDPVLVYIIIFSQICVTEFFPLNSIYNVWVIQKKSRERHRVFDQNQESIYCRMCCELSNTVIKSSHYLASQWMFSLYTAIHLSAVIHLVSPTSFRQSMALGKIKVGPHMLKYCTNSTVMSHSVNFHRPYLPQAKCPSSNQAERCSISLPDHRENCTALQLHSPLYTSLHSSLWSMLGGNRKLQPGRRWSLEMWLITEPKYTPKKKTG